MKRITKEAAIENLRRMFGEKEKTSISVEDIWHLWKRTTYDKEANRIWLSNKLLDLKHYGFIQPMYQFRNSRKVLKGIRLTEKGQESLRETKHDDNKEINHENNQESRHDIEESKLTSFNVLLKDIATLQKNHPEYTIRFTIELKEAG